MSGSVVWLHGMGQAAGTMREVAAAAGLLAEPGLRHVTPEAPLRRVGLVETRPVRSWMDQTVTRLGTPDRRELRATVDRLRAVIDEEVDAVGPGRVVLAGFSQGAALSLLLGLTHGRRLAGLALYAPFVVRNVSTGAARFGPNLGLPVWIGHGSQDGAIPVEMSKTLSESLRARGYGVRFHEYPAGHQPFALAEADLGGFVRELLGPGAS